MTSHVTFSRCRKINCLPSFGHSCCVVSKREEHNTFVIVNRLSCTAILSSELSQRGPLAIGLIGKRLIGIAFSFFFCFQVVDFLLSFPSDCTLPAEDSRMLRSVMKKQISGSNSARNSSTRRSLTQGKGTVKEDEGRTSTGSSPAESSSLLSDVMLVIRGTPEIRDYDPTEDAEWWRRQADKMAGKRRKMMEAEVVNISEDEEDEKVKSQGKDLQKGRFSVHKLLWCNFFFPP